MLKTHRDRGLVWPTFLTLLGLAVLVGLGTWQLQRKAWKEGLIAEIAARTKAEPVPLETAVRMGAPRGAEYLRVTASGRFLHAFERYYYAPDPRLGPGYHVYTPLEIAGTGELLFVNRGFVPQSLRDPAARQQGQVDGTVELTGLVRAPGEKGAFTPENDPAGNRWFWRDLAGMTASTANGVRPRAGVLPFFLDAEANPANPGGWPRGGVTEINLPNRHLEYALTWYGLALTLIGVYAAFAWQRTRRPNPDP